MQKWKAVVLVVSLLLIAVLMIPSLLVLPFTGQVSGKLNERTKEQDLLVLLEEASAVEVSVYRSAKDEVEQIPLEKYVLGVVASEMPVEFEEEALKAQALSARTEIVRHLLSDTEIGLLKGADIGDSEQFQVFKNEAELKKQWGLNYQKNIEKISQAVYSTRGQIITYENKPITAAYFSTSNGFTENSEAYWTTPYPYLKSVESPWDIESPKFQHQVAIPVEEFEEKLGVQLKDGQVGEIVARTPGNRVAKVKIGDKEWTGREIRDMFGLRSADFTWERAGDEIIITTKGYGHGIGMSQYGANGMAKEGKTYEEIIKYFYQGVEIQDASQFLNTQLAKE